MLDGQKQGCSLHLWLNGLYEGRTHKEPFAARTNETDHCRGVNSYTPDTYMCSWLKKSESAARRGQWGQFKCLSQDVKQVDATLQVDQ